MKIVIAKTAGFCFGVKRAVDAVSANIGKKKLYTYGAIIHNPQVVELFKKQGVFPIDDPLDINEGAVVIRAHGAPEDIFSLFREKNIEIIDATCPFVERIQKKVRNALLNNQFIVIIGEKQHPEVIGINGHCENKAYVVNSGVEAMALPPTDKPICIVAQTTSTQKVYEEVVEVLRKKYYNNPINEYNTICDATRARQEEAISLAKYADVMAVIGGAQSSNTAKLVKICSEYCQRTYAVESVDDAAAIKIQNNDIIGITAGASTPDWLIKEVVDKMSENEMLNDQGCSFEEEMNKTLVKIHPGQVLKGKVIYVLPNEVSVDIGYKADGLIAKEELSASGTVEPSELYKPGDEIEVEVLKVNDGNGSVILSRKAVISRLEADKTLAKIQEGEPFEVVVKEAVKGGVTAEYDGIRVFIPRSQLRAKGFARDLDKFVGQTLRVKAIEVDIKHRKVVATHGQLVQEEHAAKLEEAWGKLEVGATITGVVRRLTDFGAFVDIGGVDGLVHIGDMAWYHVNKPSDVLSVNQEIEVVVLALDKEHERISLGYKQLQPKPWDTAAERYAVDTVVKGTVVRITPFGAFVALEQGIDGLVHISEVSNKFISKVEDALTVGQEVEALVLDVNTETKRISLSIRALIQPIEEDEIEAAPQEEGEVCPEN